MIRAIIVEDDPQHCAALTALLNNAKKKVKVLSVCRNLADAESAIKKLKPELLFLDIDLENGENGFDLLRRFDQSGFAVIFTTQHTNTDNAISAIRACALDFLPKPLLLSELDHALDRYNKPVSIEQVQSLKENIGFEKEWVKTIWIAATDGRVRIEVNNIIYCESDNVYTNFYLRNPVDKKRLHISSQPIKHWEQSLHSSDIMRVHNEYLVNLTEVEKYKAKLSGSACLKLNSGMEIPVSKSRKQSVIKRLAVYRKG